MKNFAARFCTLILLTLSFISMMPSALAQDKVVVGYFSMDLQEDFEKKVKPFFAENSCKTCEIVNLTPYDEKGVYDEKKLLEKLNTLPADVSFVFFAFNKKMTPQNKDLVEALIQLTGKGMMVLSSPGVAPDGEGILPLSATVMGKAQDVVIIGEITQREVLYPPKSYFGPEMLAAIRVPKDLQGQGVGSMYFASRLATAWNKRKSSEWLQHFRSKKMKSRKLWLDTEDLIGR